MAAAIVLGDGVVPLASAASIAAAAFDLRSSFRSYTDRPRITQPVMILSGGGVGSCVGSGDWPELIAIASALTIGGGVGEVQSSAVSAVEAVGLRISSVRIAANRNSTSSTEAETGSDLIAVFEGVSLFSGDRKQC